MKKEKPESPDNRTGNKQKQNQKRDPLAERVRKLLSEEPAPLLPDDVRAADDFDVYQIELKMQHEALRVADKKIREAHARYVDLYDFAPVGYLTFEQDGLVKEVNLTAADLLGYERNFSDRKTVCNDHRSRPETRFARSY